MSTKLRMRGWVVALAALASLAGPGCGDTVRTGRSPAYLIIEELLGVRGGEDDEETGVLSSDVLTNNSIFEDRGLVTFRLALKDVDLGAVTGPTDNNAITVTRYRVSYRRTDGRNTPGVDVPWPFEGAGTVTVSDRAELEFSLVRLQAKLEAPLIQLSATSGLGGAGILSTIADITFFGRDQTGNEVSVTGSIGVNFADWADPEN
jgi:hypothetical protein